MGIVLEGLRGKTGITNLSSRERQNTNMQYHEEIELVQKSSFGFHYLSELSDPFNLATNTEKACTQLGTAALRCIPSHLNIPRRIHMTYLIRLTVLSFILMVWFFPTQLTAQSPWQVGGPAFGQITPASGNRTFLSSGFGGLMVTTDDGTSWTNLGLTNNDLRQVCISPANGYIFVASASASPIGGIYRSTDQGVNWSAANNGMGTIAVRAVASNSSGILFAGTYVNGVYRSTDNGNNWTKVSTAYNIFDILISSSDSIFVGCDAGVYRSSGNGTSWTLVNTGITNLHICSMALNPSGHLFAGTWDTPYIYRSTNNGNNWTQMNNPALALGSIRDITFDPKNGDGYVANDSGVYRSTNNFTSWALMTPPAPTNISQGQRSLNMAVCVGLTAGNYLFASFASGALLRTTTPTPSGVGLSLLPVSFNLCQNYPNPFNPSTTIEYQLTARSNVAIKVFNSLGQAVKTLIAGETKGPGNHSVTWDGRNESGITVSSGTYFYQVIVNGQVQTKKMLMVK